MVGPALALALALLALGRQPSRGGSSKQLGNNIGRKGSQTLVAINQKVRDSEKKEMLFQFYFLDLQSMFQSLSLPYGFVFASISLSLSSSNFGHIFYPIGANLSSYFSFIEHGYSSSSLNSPFFQSQHRRYYLIYIFLFFFRKNRIDHTPSRELPFFLSFPSLSLSLLRCWPGQIIIL